MLELVERLSVRPCLGDLRLYLRPPRRLDVEVHYVGSVGHGVYWDTVN